VNVDITFETQEELIQKFMDYYTIDNEINNLELFISVAMDIL